MENSKLIYLISSNRDKCQEISEYFRNNLKVNYEMNVIEKFKNGEIKEIQAETSKDIVEEKCKIAVELLREELGDISGYVIVEDTSFGVDKMNGLPGPYIRDFFLKLGNRKFYDLVLNFNMNTEKIIARDICVLCVAKLKQGIVEYTNVYNGEVMGTIVKPQNNECDEYNWGFFFCPQDADKTYGEMTPKEKNNYSARQMALKPFCFFLNNN
jgi:inosine triphosphate pyrophosphatase